MQIDTTLAWLGAVECLSKTMWNYMTPEEIRSDLERIRVLMSARGLIRASLRPEMDELVREHAPHLSLVFQEVALRDIFAPGP
jgi:hypothetical protein